MADDIAPASTTYPKKLDESVVAAPPLGATENAETAPQASETETTDSRWWLTLWIIALAAAVISPGLTWAGIANRPFVIRVDLFLMMTAMIGAVALVLVTILSRAFRSRIRWSLGVTTILIFAAFQWPLFNMVGGVAARRLSLPILGEVVPVALAAALIFVAVRRADTRPFGVAAAEMGILFVVGATIVLWPHLPPSPEPVDAPPAASGQPDVLLIILDEYNRADVLAEQFGYDNSPFLSQLEDRGYVIAEQATANYNSTFASISTMLAQDYTYLPGPLDGSRDPGMREALAGDAALFRRFKEAGYDVTFVESGWGGSQCSALVDTCIREGLTYRSVWLLGQVTILAPLLKGSMSHPFNSGSMEHLADMPAYLERDREEGTPRLSIVHLILPHPPFERDADCEYLNTTLAGELERTGLGFVDLRRLRYVEQMKCTNDMLVAALDEITAAHPDIHVMITGDHGSATPISQDKTSESRSDEVVKERMAIVGAYRLPGCNTAVPMNVSPVNGSRIITNCALGINLEPVADRSYWLPPNLQFKGSVVDVTDRVGN